MAMQKATGMVRLGGSLLHTVRKKGMTPAEVVILRAIHGADAVNELEAERADFTTPGDDLERLRDTYGIDAVAAAYPGAQVIVPTNFSEIGIQIGRETLRTRAAREARNIDTEEDDIDLSQIFNTAAAEKEAAGDLL